jgi:predicted peptidase
MKLKRMKRIATAVIAALATMGAIPLAQAQSGGVSDPLYKAKGDHERTYKFVEAGIDSPYRIYVPQSWDGAKRLPLVVILHGSNLNHDAAFDREPADLKGILFRETEKHGFIVVAPEGYKGGSYGNTFPIPLSQYLHPGPGGPRGPHRPDRSIGDELIPAGPMPSGPTPPGGEAQGAPQRRDATAPELNQPMNQSGGFGPRLAPEERERNNKLAEQDVLNVIGIVSKEYNTDPARLYLMGNSMGGIGTYYLAATHPKMFTAIAPSDGPLDPAFYSYEMVKGIGGVMIVHGEDDPVAPIDDSEMMAFLFKQAAMETRGTSNCRRSSTSSMLT